MKCKLMTIEHCYIICFTQHHIPYIHCSILPNTTEHVLASSLCDHMQYMENVVNILCVCSINVIFHIYVYLAMYIVNYYNICVGFGGCKTKPKHTKTMTCFVTCTRYNPSRFGQCFMVADQRRT